MLVELGFDVDSINNNGSTPLHRACYRNNIELVILLTNHGADYMLRDKVCFLCFLSHSPPSVRSQTC
jgi:ankyrin repeat protein